MNEISYTYFEKIEIRTGTILSAEIFKKANKPAYILTIDFGESGIKKARLKLQNFIRHKI